MSLTNSLTSTLTNLAPYHVTDLALAAAGSTRSNMMSIVISFSTVLIQLLRASLNVLVKTFLKHLFLLPSVRDTVTISDYMHIFNFPFNIPISPFLTDILLLFSTKDMSRNDA